VFVILQGKIKEGRRLKATPLNTRNTGSAEPQRNPGLSLFVTIETAVFFSFVTVDFFLAMFLHT